MRILVCSPSFPTSKTIDFIFVDQLCRAFADLGHEVVIIAPQSLTKCLMRHVPLSKRHSVYKTNKGKSIELFRPYYISLGNSSLKLFKKSYKNAVKRAFLQIKSKPDVCYGHFWKSIFNLYPLAKENSIPLFGASGEENVGYYVHKTDIVDEIRDYLGGVVSVSTKNQLECFNLNLITRNKSVVIPNAIDQQLFRKLDNEKCRKALGIAEDDFVVTFVGQFVARKGTMRLNDALKKIGDKRIKAVFIGSGSENPDYEYIIKKGRVEHEKVPIWLNAADVFVLPTENEGCSNAIVEAMACGLPVISTDAPFNYDILNEHNSIMVDCHDIKDIADAILKLKEDVQLRHQLCEGALATAEGMSIEKRAKKIVEFMQKQLMK